MGLDMHLRGEKSHWRDWDNPKNDPTEDGFRLDATILDLGYWRKHPNLHGFIVQTFADGKDECQRINLEPDDLRALLDAVRNPDKLPKTEGFFFGESEGTPAEVANDVKILTGALKWLEDVPGTEGSPRQHREVYYEASW